MTLKVLDTKSVFSIGLSPVVVASVTAPVYGLNHLPRDYRQFSFYKRSPSRTPTARGSLVAHTRTPRSMCGLWEAKTATVRQSPQVKAVRQ